MALTQANVASSETADSFLNASHLTRTRHGHQVSLLALHKLQDDAFLSCTEGPHNAEMKEAWRQSMIQKCPTFKYWDTVLQIELSLYVVSQDHHF